MVRGGWVGSRDGERGEGQKIRTKKYSIELIMWLISLKKRKKSHY